MITKTIFKKGFRILLVSSLVISCTCKNQESAETNNRLSDSSKVPNGDIVKEKSEIKNQALVIISDFNNRANEIKVEAYKKSESLDDTVKKMLIEIEGQVTRLDDRLNEMNYQSGETWPGFSKIVSRELDAIKRNIDKLSNKDLG